MTLEEAQEKFIIEKKDVKHPGVYVIKALLNNPKEITIPSKIDDIDVQLGELFAYDTLSCKKVIIEEGMTSIYTAAFKDTNIDEVQLPKSVKKIERYAFQNSTLKKINLENVENIDNFAFNRNNIKEVNLRNINKIGLYAFVDCEQLEKVEFSNKITKIDTGAFKNTNIKELDLKNITEIKKGAFLDCRRLQTINGDKIEELKDEVFSNCLELDTVDLPNLKEISHIGFASCYIKDLNIREDVKINNAFLECYIDNLNFYKSAVISELSFTRSTVKNILADGELKIEDTTFDKSCINNLILKDNFSVFKKKSYGHLSDTEIYAINIYKEIKDFPTLLNKKTIINSYDNADYEYPNVAKFCTYKELDEKDFTISQINQILKAQQMGLLLSCIPIETSVETLKDIIAISKKDITIGNELKYLITNDDTLENKIKINEIISKNLEKEEGDKNERRYDKDI